ncbi:MAG: YlmC/YmxH family sporulation protein [Firmicutes bacterium]|jgi:YlmC/YmxH family sporulation protein|nr:YlmC/YmxH family sporulation protein [Bacillota bacterium]NLL88681.1 YlmC/YmxH family sporulation protein [Bacillota bacterium]HKM17452.1 YlmC/YmxH family sporulation protein [Limnochordia bacterium]
MYIRTSELQRLDVVNIEDGRFLGNVCDVDLDPDTGELRFLVLERPERGILRFFRHDDLEIPWHEVVLIGVDVVLVRTKLETTPKYRAWQTQR